MIGAIETDTHGGHKEGLCPPELESAVEGTKEPVTLNAAQVRLHEIRQTNLAELKKLTRRKEWIYLHGGDQTQGVKYIEGVGAIEQSRQNKIAYNNMLPILKMKPTWIRIAKGTPSHEWGDGGSATILNDYYRMKFPDLDIKTVWNGWIKIKGFRIDYKHHGPSKGSRRWTEQNGGLLYLRSEMLDELSNGRTPPNLYIRGHIHQEIWVTWHEKFNGKWHTSTLITVPSMCGVSAFEWQAIKNLKRITNGMVVFKTDGPLITDVKWWTNTLDLRYEESYD